MSSFPTPVPSDTKEDIRTFFDNFAADNVERHGPAEALLAQRIDVLNRYAEFQSSDVVLDVGCGDGTHLRALSERIDRGIGVDFAPRMVDVARSRTNDASLSFHIDDAEHLSTIPDASVDVVICVGVLEHVLHPNRVFHQVRRVLKEEGRFVALTLNGTYWWYRLADRFRIPTRHLTTDRRLHPVQARRLMQRSGLRARVGFWEFVPSGDVPSPVSLLCQTLDRLGRWASAASLRGGLRLCGRLG